MNRNGFTLIELLVVVAIIGILAAVGVVAYNGYTGAAKRAKSMQQHKDVLRVMSAKWGLCEIQGGNIYWCWGGAKWGTSCDEMKPASNNNQVAAESCSNSPNGGANKFGNHFQSIGYENPYGKDCENCQKNGRSVDHWNEPGNLKNFKAAYSFDQPLGETRIACNGFPNQNDCQIRTTIAEGEHLYDIVTKSSGM